MSIPRTFRARVVLQCSFLLLGSCYPFTPPSTQVIIYNHGGPEDKQSLPHHGEALTCKKTVEYKLPPIPDFEGVDEEDTDAIIEVLTEHIGVLRKELKRVATECVSERR